MGEQVIADDVTRGVDVGMPGPVVLVGLDEALLDLDVELLQPEAVGDPLAADRDQQALAVDLLRLVADLDADRHLAVG